jgi:hypothetical protein
MAPGSGMLLFDSSEYSRKRLPMPEPERVLLVLIALPPAASDAILLETLRRVDIREDQE